MVLNLIWPILYWLLRCESRWCSWTWSDYVNALLHVHESIILVSVSTLLLYNYCNNCHSCFSLVGCTCRSLIFHPSVHCASFKIILSIDLNNHYSLAPKATLNIIGITWSPPPGKKSESEIVPSLYLLSVGKIDPILLPMWNKRWYIWDKRCYIRDKLHATVDVSNIPSCWVTSVFYSCYLEEWNVSSKFQTSVTFLFVNEKCGFS